MRGSRWFWGPGNRYWWTLGVVQRLLTPACVRPQTGQLEPLLSGFTEEEEQQMRRMLQRMDVLAKVEGLGCARGLGGACLT